MTYKILLEGLNAQRKHCKKLDMCYLPSLLLVEDVIIKVHEGVQKIWVTITFRGEYFILSYYKSRLPEIQCPRES